MSDYQHPGTYQRPSTLQSCRRCTTPTLDAVLDGVALTLDALPLTATGELHARLAGRLVVNVQLLGEGDIALSFRFARHLTEELPVLAEHRCGNATTDVDAKLAEMLTAALTFQRETYSEERLPF